LEQTIRSEISISPEKQAFSLAESLRDGHLPCFMPARWLAA
jgi:hypothetical protein